MTIGDWLVLSGVHGVSHLATHYDERSGYYTFACGRNERASRLGSSRAARRCILCTKISSKLAGAPAGVPTMAYFENVVMLGSIDVPHVARFANREFDRLVPIDELQDTEAQELRAAVDALEVESEQKIASIRIALDMRDARFYMVPLFEAA